MRARLKTSCLKGGNLYLGRNVDAPADPKGVVDMSAKRQDVVWDQPEFDPAHPEEFDDYISKHRAWMMALFDKQFGPVKLGR